MNLSSVSTTLLLLTTSNLALLASAQIGDFQFNNATYFALSAQEKQTEVWSYVIANTTSNVWPTPGGALTESVNSTVHQPGDQMMTDQTTGIERVKQVHSVGCVAKVRFVPSGDYHPFTGAWRTGTEYAVARLSMAGEPNPDVKLTVPAMALKFFRDGIESASIQTMYSVAGQSTWNFFANDFANHVPSIVGSPGIDALQSHFATVSNYPQGVSTSDFAKYEIDGTAVSQPVFPYQLRLEPSGEVEFPDEYSGMLWTDQLMTIQPNTVLYHIYGIDEPEDLDGQEYYLGDIQTTSELTTSIFGDRDLFFRHQRLEEDLALRPEWQPFEIYTPTPIDSAEGSQRGAGCPFAHLWQ